MKLTITNSGNITLHIAFITIALIGLQVLQSDLVFQRHAINDGEFWRIITGNLVHTNIPHLVMNITGLWLFWMLFDENLTASLLYFSLLVTGLTVGIGIYLLNPELIWYAGLSGSLYGLYIIGATSALCNKDYISSIPVLMLIPGKLFIDATQKGMSNVSAELIGAPVATDAHFYGFFSAIFISILIVINYVVSSPKPDAQ